VSYAEKLDHYSLKFFLTNRPNISKRKEMLDSKLRDVLCVILEYIEVLSICVVNRQFTSPGLGTHLVERSDCLKFGANGRQANPSNTHFESNQKKRIVQQRSKPTSNLHNPGDKRPALGLEDPAEYHVKAVDNRSAEKRRQRTQGWIEDLAFGTEKGAP
jgi:hypothetical protein